MACKFTVEQIRELKDKVINFISPTHLTLQMASRKGLSEKDVKMMLGDLNRLIKYIRGLRPVCERFEG